MFDGFLGTHSNIELQENAILGFLPPKLTFPTGVVPAFKNWSVRRAKPQRRELR